MFYMLKYNIVVWCDVTEMPSCAVLRCGTEVQKVRI